MQSSEFFVVRVSKTEIWSTLITQFLFGKFLGSLDLWGSFFKITN